MGDFSNRAYLSWSGKTVASNVVTGTFAPRVTVGKSAVEQHFERGDRITYMVSVANGTSEAKAPTLTDDLGAAGNFSPLSYIDGTAAAFTNGRRTVISPIKTAPPLVFPGLYVPAGTIVTVVYQVRVSACAGDAITNTATVTGGGIIAPVVASHTITRSLKKENGGFPPFTYSIKNFT